MGSTNLPPEFWESEGHPWRTHADPFDVIEYEEWLQRLVEKNRREAAGRSGYPKR